MDRIGLITLQAEVTDDVRAATEAATLAGQRLDQGDDSGLESCAYQLARTFNIIEQMGLRIAKAFENHIDDERGWHAELVHRLSIAVPGIRPAFYEPEIIPALRDLRGFRHVVGHASTSEVRSLTYAIEGNYPKLVAKAVELRNTAMRTGQLVVGLIRSPKSRKSRLAIFLPPLIAILSVR